METISVYIHVPLCVKKCAYCDFASFSGRMSQAEAYVQAVCCEIRAQAAFFGARRVKTVFFGGGTPTLLNGEQIKRLMDTLRTSFVLEPDAEISMEGNPGTLIRENLAAYRASGVNRLSLGIQSFDDTLLARIGRIHSARQAREAVAMAREAGFDNLNLDLMNGLPGQNAEQWRRTLETAVLLAPEHLSCYNLIVEEGTPLYDAVQAGTCAPLPNEDALAEMDEWTEQMTRQAGYERYEVSNYAKPGRQCRHNLVYWECEPYLGFGLSAHSDLDGKRFYNPTDWSTYMEALQHGRLPRREEDAGGRAFERMMMGLRMMRGVDMLRFERDFGKTIADLWPTSTERFLKGGLMEQKKNRLFLTARGMQVMNGILVEMMEETGD